MTKPEGYTLSEVPPHVWREWDHERREKFTFDWLRLGFVAFSCLGCGYPCVRAVSCEACK